MTCDSMAAGECPQVQQCTHPGRRVCTTLLDTTSSLESPHQCPRCKYLCTQHINLASSCIAMPHLPWRVQLCSDLPDLTNAQLLQAVARTPTSAQRLMRRVPDTEPAWGMRARRTSGLSNASANGKPPSATFSVSQNKAPGSCALLKMLSAPSLETGRQAEPQGLVQVLQVDSQ